MNPDDDNEGPLKMPAGDILGRYIMLRDWSSAIEEVRRRLEKAETHRKRGFYHLFLATLYKMVVKGAKRRRNTEQIEGYRTMAEQAYRASLHEDPHNITARLSFAEFYLRHMGDANAALVLLQPFSGEDYSSQLSMAQQEHKRRALLGGAYAMRGDSAQAAKWFMQAYADDGLRRELRHSYNTIFWTLITHGVKLPRPVLNEVFENLRAYQNYKPKNVARFLQELASTPDT